MNILITGGYGLIGRNLVAELSKNNSFKIFLISRTKKAEYKSKNIVNIYHDLSKSIPGEKIPKNINIIIHLAAIAHKLNFHTMAVNCLMTKNLIDAFINEKVRFVCYSN